MSKYPPNRVMTRYKGKIKKYDARLAALYHMVRELEDLGLDTKEEKVRIKARINELLDK